MKIKNNFYVITGGPGVGKTTLIDELRRRGYNCVSEVARHVIKEQMDMNGDALPWLNSRKYSDMMLSYSIHDFINYSETTDLHFFDRGIPDTYGYEVLMNYTIGKELMDAVMQYRYNPKVFILPPWLDIYETDSERKQDFEEAIRTYDVMQNIYKELGYTLIEVPKLPICERANFVIEKIKEG